MSCGEKLPRSRKFKKLKDDDDDKDIIKTLAMLSRAFNRCYATKPAIALLSKLRQETQAPLSKAKEALVHSNNEYSKALAWLQEDLRQSGAKKAQKVASRTATDGLIALAISNPGHRDSRAAMIELNCETDFVGRNDTFKTLATRLALTAHMIPEEASGKIVSQLPSEGLSLCPLLPDPESKTLESTGSVSDSIVDAIGKLGENISLRRAVTAASPNGILLNAYMHGGSSGALSTGRIGAIVALQVDGNSSDQHLNDNLAKLSRNLARHIAGFDPLAVSDTIRGRYGQKANESIPSDRFLLEQDFITGGGKVADVLRDFEKMYGIGVQVVEFARWQTGEDM